MFILKHRNTYTKLKHGMWYYSVHPGTQFTSQSTAKNSSENDAMRAQNVYSPRASVSKSLRFWKFAWYRSEINNNVLFLSPDKFGIKICARILTFPYCKYYCRVTCRRVRIQQSLRHYQNSKYYNSASSNSHKFFNPYLIFTKNI